MVCRYAERVFAMILRQVTNPMDAQELTQDTFLRAFSHIDNYDASRASLSTWLCRIAYHLTLDFMKRRRMPMVSVEESDSWQTAVGEEQLEADLSTGREERIQELERLIDALPDEERLLLTLYYYENRPLTEIAYIIGVNPKALANRLYRIRIKIHQQMKI